MGENRQKSQQTKNASEIKKAKDRSRSDAAKEQWADPEVRKKRSEALKVFWADKKNKERMRAACRNGWVARDDRREAVSRGVSAFRTGRPLTVAHKAAIAASATGQRHSVETREKISQANCGHVYTPEQLAAYKQAAVRRENSLRPLREALRQERSLQMQLRWHKCLCSEDCAAIVKDPDLMYARGHNPESAKELGNYYPCLYFTERRVVPMRGSYEVLYAQYLTSKGIAWEYEPETFEVGFGDWTGRTYTPDFYLPDSDTYVEVKGYLRPDAVRKMAAFRQLYPDLTLKMVMGPGKIAAIRAHFGLPQEKKH